jgi:CheY-like chemotaxis protein
MSAKPLFRVGVYGLDVRDVRLIEIVFKHSQYNKFEFRRADRGDPLEVDLMVVNTNDPAGGAAVQAATQSGKLIPIIAVVSRGAQTSARHAISIDRLTLQLLPILNRVVELELSNPETQPMPERQQELTASAQFQASIAAASFAPHASRQLPTPAPVAAPANEQQPSSHDLGDLVDSRIMAEALRAAEPVARIPAPPQYPQLPSLDAPTRQFAHAQPETQSAEVANAAPNSMYQGAPLDSSASRMRMPSSTPQMRPVDPRVAAPQVTAKAPDVLKNLVQFPTPDASAGQQRLRALIVDDSPTVRSQLASALNKMGILAEVAPGAREALEMLDHQHFDVAMVDVVMPDMDGYKLTREIKRNKTLRGMPVIILTSKSSPFDLARGALSGCDSYLTKPVPLKQLEAALVKLLRKSLAIDDLSALLKVSTDTRPSAAKSALSRTA